MVVSALGWFPAGRELDCRRVRRSGMRTRLCVPLLFVAMAAAALIACSDDGKSMVASPDRAEILGAVLGQLPLVQRGSTSLAAVNIVDRFGRYDGNGRLEPDPRGELLSAEDRAAIVGALKGSEVSWVADFGNARAGGLSSTTNDPEVHLTAIVSLPRMDGSRATVSVAFRCGLGCHEGSSVVVERDDAGRWTRITRGGGYIE